MARGGARTNRLMPDMLVILEMPDMVMDSTRFTRVHNKVMKAALVEELELHQRRRIPRHFKTTARSRYGYKERKAVTKAKKMRKGRGRTDLVHSGKTKVQMVNRGWKITTPGSGTDIIARMQTKFPFPASKDNTSPGAVNMKQMAKEITAVATDEVKEIETGVARRYEKGLREALQQAPRLRTRLGEGQLRPT